MMFKRQRVSSYSKEAGLLSRGLDLGEWRASRRIGSRSTDNPRLIQEQANEKSGCLQKGRTEFAAGGRHAFLGRPASAPTRPAASPSRGWNGYKCTPLLPGIWFLFSFSLHVDNTLENHFYSSRPSLISPREPSDPTLVDDSHRRYPRVKLFALGHLVWSVYSRSVRKDGGAFGCCIESGDDLNPDLSRSAFGRVAGVGSGRSLTGVFFSSFSLLAGACSLAVRKKLLVRACGRCPPGHLFGEGG